MLHFLESIVFFSKYSRFRQQASYVSVKITCNGTVYIEMNPDVQARIIAELLK